MKTTIRVATAAALLLGTSMALTETGRQAGDPAMAAMHQTMQQIRATEDPEKRAELLEEHLNEMHAVMERMHGDLAQLMEGMQEQKRESKRLHDHRKMNR